MHRGHQKLSLFKSNRSQASLLSNLSAAPSDQHRGDLRPQISSPSAQPSPLDSPLYSPSFPPNESASASPLGPEEDRSPFQDYNPTQTEEPAQKPQVIQKQGRNKLRRSTSHRSYPTSAAAVGSSGPKSGSASQTTSSGVNLDNGDQRNAQNSPTAGKQDKTSPDQKKKKRFWSLGDQSSKEKPPNSSQSVGLGRSLSNRGSQVSGHSPDSSTSQLTSRPRWQASGILPSPSEEDEPKGEIVPRKISNRHSVAFPHPTVPEELRHSVGSGGFDINSPHIVKSQDTLATTAASQSSSGQGGTHRTSFRDRSGHRPHHSRTVSQEPYGGYNTPYQLASGLVGGQKIKPELNYPEGWYNSDSRPPTRQSPDAPSSPSQSQIAFHQKSPSVQSAVSITDSMGPVQGQQHNSGRSTDTTQSNTQGQYGSTLSVNNQQGTGNYRGTPQTQAQMVQQNNSSTEQGRSTPPPSRSRDDLSQLDVQQLMSKHEELNDKYRKVKKYYFDKDAQVQQLQNTLAHQRLAQSRTSLDDNEYATRFSRLDGAINNLAFNIRKDWKAVPRWLAPYVNQDATTTVTKEMTAVGRACISRWIVDEIFDRYFHPAIEPNLSSSLKSIERNLRRFAPPAQTDEERDALLSKISNWRLATLDGLQDQLSMHEATEYRSSLTKILVEMLTTDLTANLKEPAPQGLEAGVIGIIELAVGISANLPMESRDVFVDYVMPGTLVNDAYMKVEGALPPLTNPGEGGSHDVEGASIGGADGDEDEGMGEQLQQGKKKGGGMFGSLMGTAGKKTQGTAGGRSQESVEQVPKDPKVRFAAFMSVEVRGKTMLIKAPVYV